MSYHGADREERAERERDGGDSTAMGRRSYMRIAATTGALLGVGVGGGDAEWLARPAYAYAPDGTEVLRAGEIPVAASGTGSTDAPRAATVGVGDRVGGDLASDGHDWVATDAPGGEELTLAFERASGSGTAAVAVYGPDGAFVDMLVEGAAPNELTVAPDATGTLFAQVVDLDGATGRYALGVREGGSASRAVPPSADGARVWVEAESAQGGADFAPFEVRSDAAAANGEYITTPDEGRNNYDGPPAEGRAEYTFEVPADGEYAVWGRTRVQSNGNTFYVGLDGAADTEWHVDMADGWNWAETPLSATLSAGTHTLTVAYREDGTALDKLLVTADPDFQPSGTGGGAAATPTQSPFADHDRSRIEAESYDEGGEGVAYHDTTAGNEGGAFRDDGVDVESTAGGGHNVGWVHDGEWLEYTVDIPASTYDLRARLASTDGGARLRATLDGDPLGTFTVPDTGGWQTWETVTLPGVETDGGSVLRLEAVGGGFNVNWVGFAEPDASAPPSPPASTGAGVVSGELKEWHTATLTFDGPRASESGDPNPFRDYRLQVEFRGPSGQSYDVPGFFAGDGDGGSAGTKWRCRFSPDEAGEWSYEASFRAGDDVAVSLADDAGTPAAFDGASGTFSVAATDKSGRDFRAHGTITNHGGHYLQHADGTYWLKGGPDVPENFLAHDFDAHGGRRGAVDYVADAGCNCIYFLPNNVGGDGNDTWPHPSRWGDRDRYDLSKMREWTALFEHAESRGVFLHFQLAETEPRNENYYDGGGLGPQRKLYYRELVARFGHVAGAEFDVGEENDYGADARRAFLDYLDAVDPYGHPKTTHTHSGRIPEFYDPLLGTDDVDVTAWQTTADARDLADLVAEYRRRSADADHPWVVSVDEPGGIENDPDDYDSGLPWGRRTQMWPTYFGGGGGFEWYVERDGSGHGLDQALSDFGAVQPALDWTGYALDFLSSLPLHRMTPDHGRVSGGAGYCLAADDGDAVAVYLPDGDAVGVDLPDGSFGVDWFDPKTGETYDGGTLAGGDAAELGSPPFDGDAAAVLRG